LINQEGGAFLDENVHLVVGPAATRERIRYELEDWLPSVAKEPDRVIVYFAGHGFVNKGRGYLAPWDVDRHRLDETAYPMKELGTAMATKVKARWKVLLIDACHSGKVIPDSSNEAVDASLNDLPKAFLTFSATRENQQSFEDPKLGGGFGLFSYFLVQGLKGAADVAPCDGIITADELVEYVRWQVRNYSKAHKASQTPNERGPFDENMILGVGKGCPAKIPASEEQNLTGTLVIEANTDDVFIYLDDDDQTRGKVDHDKSLRLPGIVRGLHVVRGVRQGYEPDSKQVVVVPGEVRTVTLRIVYQQHKKSAQDLLQRGERLLFEHKSSLNPLEVYVPRKENLTKARDLFLAAFKQDPHYAQAAYRLASAYVLLSEEKEALKWFREVVRIDPTNVEARTEYAGALIESGDTDQAIRELLEASRVEPKNDIIISLLGRAFLDKGVWDLALKYNTEAIGLRAENEQAYLWRAEALRQLARHDNSYSLALYESARDDFRRFLRMTDFSTSLGSQVGFYFIGFGVGRRRHADRDVAYKAQRGMAYTGICHCEQKLGNLVLAVSYCQRALKFDANDATAHFFLGNAYRELFNQSVNDKAPRCQYLLNARSEYARTVKSNPDIDEAKIARSYLEEIAMTVSKLRCGSFSSK
jgi:tetratricopeptide (TPR) repeat protein